MKYKMLLLLMSSVVCMGSLLDRSLDYIKDSQEKSAAYHATRPIKRFLNAQASIKYWRYLTEQQGDGRCLMDQSENGTSTRRLGLVEDDIEQIENFIKKYRTTVPSLNDQSCDPIDIDYLEFAIPVLPAFLARKYINKTQEVIDSMAANDNYAYLGPEKIHYSQKISKHHRIKKNQKKQEIEKVRGLTIEYIFHEWNKLTGQPQKYFFVLRKNDETKNERLKEIFKRKIQKALDEFKNMEEYAHNITDEDITLDTSDTLINYKELRLVSVKGHKSYIPMVTYQLTGSADYSSMQSLKLAEIFEDSFTKIPAYFTVFDSCKKISFFAKNIKEIENFFLFGHSALRSIDLTGLSNVTIIGNDFLYRCNGLTELDLTPLSNVQEVGDGFLYCCQNLQKIIIPNRLYSLLLAKDSKFFEQFPKLTKENIILKYYDLELEEEIDDSRKEDNGFSFPCAIHSCVIQ